MRLHGMRILLLLTTAGLAAFIAWSFIDIGTDTDLSSVDQNDRSLGEELSAVESGLSQVPGGGGPTSDPACSDDVAGESCSSRDVSSFNPFSRSSSGVAFSQEETPTVEEVLEKGLRSAGASPVHLAVRGTASVDSVRCGWRGIARTIGQREDAIRYWLGLGAEEAIPSDTLVEGLFTITLDTLVIRNVRFNDKCVVGSAYGVLVHEAGYVLGVGQAPQDPMKRDDYDAHHPRVPGAVMNYDERVPPAYTLEEPDCSPHPLDIMAIYAMYQTE